MSRVWKIVSGEFPPALGGVGDYSKMVAKGLVSRGEHVEVITNGDDASSLNEDGVVVSRTPNAFQSGNLKQSLPIGKSYSPFETRWFVQYVPHAFGNSAMNIGFVRRISVLSKQTDHHVWVMFHEVAFPWVASPLKHNLIAAVNRWMAWRLIHAAERIFVSTDSWTPILRRFGAKVEQVNSLPIPANVTPVTADFRVKALRRVLTMDKPGCRIFGSFGSFGVLVSRILIPWILQLFRSSQPIVVHLIGSGSNEFRHQFCKEFPNFSDRITATGPLATNEISVHIQACEIMLQPYPDGANTRRSSLMACLAHGKTTLTSRGHNTEPLWDRVPGIWIAQSNSTRIVETIGSMNWNDGLLQKQIQFYAENFSCERTCDKLLC